MPVDKLEKQLAHLTDVTILGKKVPVKFLEGEVHLLALRAKYDRALDILRDYFKDLLRGTVENVIIFDDLVSSLESSTKDIAEGLGVFLELDKSYYNLYQPVAESLRKVYTIRRLRMWLRYVMYRLFHRFGEGYITKEELEQVISEVSKHAYLTDEEKEFLVFIAEEIAEVYLRETQAEGILRKLSRGVISVEEAKKELAELGLEEPTIDALIEKYMKTYTLTISSYLAYADLVEIPEDLLKKKLDLMGVPEDEKDIILQVFAVKPLKDERARAIRRQMRLFADGLITEETLRKNLAELTKSEREIDILVEVGKIEKEYDKTKLTISAILNRVRRGYYTLDQARKELEKIIVDPEIIDAMLEKEARVYVYSADKMIGLSEYVPIDIDTVVNKGIAQGLPEEELELLPAIKLSKDLKEEIDKCVTELVDLYEESKITLDELSVEIDNLRTLWGAVEAYGVPWIVISDEEKELILFRAELKKMKQDPNSPQLSKIAYPSPEAFLDGKKSLGVAKKARTKQSKKPSTTALARYRIVPTLPKESELKTKTDLKLKGETIFAHSKR